MRLQWVQWGFAGLSLVLHGGLSLAVSRIEPTPPPPITVPIEIIEAPPPKAEPPPPPPSEPPPPPPAEAPPTAPAPEPPRPKPPTPRRLAPAPAAKSAPAGPAPPVADLGDFELTGQGDGTVPVPSPQPAPRAAPETRAPRTLAAPRPKVADCAEPASKPRPTETPLPVYPEAARQAGVEGRARVEIEVEADGSVGRVKVLESPGHGMDAAAIAAVKRWRFTPGQRCGKPVRTTFTVRLTFAK